MKGSRAASTRPRGAPKRQSLKRSAELIEALAQREAERGILRMISQSSTDVMPVLDTIAEHAVRLCRARDARIWLIEGDRMRYVAGCGDLHPENRGDTLPVDRGWALARAILDRNPVHIRDAASVSPDEFPIDREMQRQNRHRTLLAVPLMRPDRAVGGITLRKMAVEPFTKRQIALVGTFADQAVIAIENVRLLTETKEALEHQFATADILKVISSSPTDIQPVFNAIVKSALHLFSGQAVALRLLRGDQLELTASSYLSAAGHEFSVPLDGHSGTSRAIQRREVIQIPDILTEEWVGEPIKEQARRRGYRATLCAPMMREDKVIGTIAINRVAPGPYSEKEVALLRTFADQAVIAIENVRLFDELQEKSHQLELANTYKSRFLAAASHDLRQPLHALNLFVAQLHAEADPVEHERLVGRIDAAVGAMNELFNSLLDMSKLEAGMLGTELTEFPVMRVLRHLETTFSGAAQEKGLRLTVAPSAAWVRSDFILLERILLNLVSNAVRYTNRGGIVIGCRRRGACLRIEVWDSGPGIPEDHRQSIFREFYQLAGPGRDRGGGLGLGLAIVDGLGRLLDHSVELKSRPGRGSCFSVSVPRVAARRESSEAPAELAHPTDPLRGKLVVVIDDDALVLDGMRGVLRNWGCGVVTEPSAGEALARLTELGRTPDMIISDYRLADGKTGIEAIECLRSALGKAIPAFLISGDSAPECLRDAGASGYHLLHKPVPPMALRAMLNGLLRSRDDQAPFPAGSREANRRSSATRAPARRPQ